MTTVTVIIPTRDRPKFLRRAIASALIEASAGSVELVVVDDSSSPPATVPGAAPIRLIRLDPGRGGAAARNVGLAAARGRWVTFLDDDDELLPGMIARCLEAVTASELPPPVAAVTALEVVDDQGHVVGMRHPPTLPRGSLWNLEPQPVGRSFFVKQSLFAPRAVLAELGGFDESFPARVHSELFLRLNPVCSIVGVDHLGYRHYRHGGPSITANAKVHRDAFRRLIDKHGAVLHRHPRGLATMALDHARRHRLSGEGLRWLLAAARLDPGIVAHWALAAVKRRALWLG